VGEAALMFEESGHTEPKGPELRDDDTWHTATAGWDLDRRADDDDDWIIAIRYPLSRASPARPPAVETVSMGTSESASGSHRGNAPTAGDSCASRRPRWPPRRRERRPLSER
jgi:hypothetical protein